MSAARPGRSAARLAAVALLLAAASSVAHGQQIIGELELEAPTVSPFVLHGTLPVPKGTYPRPDGKVPFSVRNVNGSLVATQVESVTTYPDDKDGADVVEVLAVVDLPGNTVPGQHVRYQVLNQPQTPAVFNPHAGLNGLVSGTNNAILVAEDCFGHKYTLDIFANFAQPSASPYAQLLRDGPIARQVRTYGVMKAANNVPKGPPSGALPHFFGVHAYATLWSKIPGLTLDLRIHNGFDGHDKSDSSDDPLGKVYFRSIELLLPPGWSIMFDLEEPTIGKPYKAGGWIHYPIVTPLPSGQMHVMPHQSQMHRRLAISPNGFEDLDLSLSRDEGLGFCRRGANYYSWWNPATARYFPQRHKLPDLSWLPTPSMENPLKNGYWMARIALQSGKPGNVFVPSGALGWAHPWGVPYGGMTGAVEINTYDGLELAEVASNKGWNYSRLQHRMIVERQPTTLYNKFGRPTSVEDWVGHAAGYDYIPMNFWLKLLNGPDPFGFNKAPTYQAQYVATNHLAPGYEAALTNYEPVDFQHYVRLTRMPKVMAWLGNDALAKDDLLHAAEIARLSFNQYPNQAGNIASGSGLLSLQQFVAAHPAHGVAWGRGQAWTMDAIAAAYAVGSRSYRVTSKPWMDQCVDLLTQGQAACSGFLQAVLVPGWLGGQWLIRSSPEQAFTEHALWAARETVYRGVDSARFAQTGHVLDLSTHAMIGPMSWSNSGKAPWYLVAVADKNLTQPPYCNSVPPGGQGNGVDNFLNWNSFAYGYELTGDPAFLTKAAIMAGNVNLLQGIKNAGLVNMVNKAALLAALQ